MSLFRKSIAAAVARLVIRHPHKCSGCCAAVPPPPPPPPPRLPPSPLLRQPSTVPRASLMGGCASTQVRRPPVDGQWRAILHGGVAFHLAHTGCHLSMRTVVLGVPLRPQPGGNVADIAERTDRTSHGLPRCQSTVVITPPCIGRQHSRCPLIGRLPWQTAPSAIGFPIVPSSNRAHTLPGCSPVTPSRLAPTF